MKNLVTMAQIAAKAGVHVTTVSLALRNHPSLPETTKERIRNLAEEMGYRPDPALRALVAYRQNCRNRKQVQTLAYVTNWDSRWVWKEFPAHAAFFAGAERRAAQLGFQLEHFWLGEPQLSERRLGDILHARGIAGVVLASQRFDRDSRLDFDWSRLAAVKIDYYPHEPQLHAVTSNQRGIVRLAVRQLLARGYRRVGLVVHRDWDWGVDAGFSTGFLEAQQVLETRDRLPVFYIEKMDPPPEERWGGRAPLEEFRAWFDRYRPEAIVGFGSAVLPRLAELGIAVPGELGFADLYLQSDDGSFAGVRHNSDHVGEMAVELLAGQLQIHNYGLPRFPTSTLVEGTWVDGATVRTVA